MNRFQTFYMIVSAVVLGTIFLVGTTFEQPNVEYPYKSPSPSTSDIKAYSESFLENSEKDILFIENLGQITDTEGEKRPDILFLTRSQGIDMYMTNSGVSYVFRNDGSNTYRLDMEFVGRNKDINIKKELAIEQQYNYYTPEYPDGISPRAYKKITFEDLYEGIDLVYYEDKGRMKYDFIIKAGSDAATIKMKYKGASSLDIDHNGSVIITTPMGEIREEKPYTYSKDTGLEIGSGYLVKNNTVLFDIEEYDESLDIIIDPLRDWATYYGGNDLDQGFDICTDNSGNLFVTGRTESYNFPTQILTGSYNQTGLGGGPYFDVFILKFNSSGERIWATYYGGNGNDQGYGICTDSYDNLYVTGYTGSNDFPTQVLTGAYNNTTWYSQADIFILKFNSSGVRQWATYYGKSNHDYGWDICTDNSDNLYVVGKTDGGNFPTHVLTGAYNQTNLGGSNDIFILKFNSSGARMWATFYGGSGSDGAWSICTDNSDNFYLTGETASSNFPTQLLSGAYNQTTLGGGSDAFILKFNSSGVRQWATYYGGNGSDGIGGTFGSGGTWNGGAICTDNSGNLYVTGETSSSDFPTQTLTGAYNQTTIGSATDAFILKFNSTGVRQWATYYGGAGKDQAHSICTDNTSNLYITGKTESSNFPTQTLAGAYNQTAIGGLGDVYIVEFNSGGVRQWATFYGGSLNERGLSLCANNSGDLYVAGGTASSDFPVLELSGAYNDSAFTGGADVFILRFDRLNPAFSVSDDTICDAGNVNFTDLSYGNVISWEWTFEGGTPGTSTTQHPSVTYNTLGTYDVQLVISDGTYTDTLLRQDFITVTTNPAQPNTPSGITETCEGNSYDYTTGSVPEATSYEWMVEPSDAGTISGFGTTGTFTASIGWTGAYTVKVRAANYCGPGTWSASLAANLNHQPLQYILVGGGSYCEGEPGRELILEGSETGVDYEVFYEGNTTGVILPGTGDTLNFGFFTEVGLYTTTGHTTYCSQEMIGQPYIIIQIIPGQAATPSGSDIVCGSDTTEYITTGSSDADSLIWILSPPEAGTLMPDEDTVEIIWSADFFGASLLSVYGTNSCGGGPVSDSLEINVNELPSPEISGNEYVLQNSTHQYSSPDHTGATYDWNVTGGTIDAGQGTHEITVTWGGPGTGTLNLTEISATNCEGVAAELIVNIDFVGIKESFTNNIIVYPNPAQSTLMVESMILPVKNTFISIKNTGGHEVVCRALLDSKVKIDISNFPTGIYIVKVWNDKDLMVRKVIKH